LFDIMMGILTDPKKEVDASVKKAGMNTTVLLLLVFGVMLLVGSLLGKVANSTDIDFLDELVSVVVSLITVAAVALIMKVPFDILSENKKDGYVKSLTAIAYGLIPIGILMILSPILIYIGIELAKATDYESVSYWSSITMIITIVLFIHGLSVITRGFSKQFNVDYITVLMTLSVFGYAFYMVIFSAMMQYLTLLGSLGGYD